ncbi:MAG: hypothetical protein JOY72_02190 [Actinobacteria bacterium]|nr:hypothetical protein [Actinomycetota bacterium]
MKPVVLRGAVVDDPLGIVLGYVVAWKLDEEPPDKPTSFEEADLRRANRGGARISAAEIEAILERRRAVVRELRAIPADASLTGTVQWAELRRLYDAFADIRGVGFAKMTKALHPKRPALVPMLDSVVQGYLAEDDVRDAPFGERAVALTRGYKRDLDRNLAAIRAVRGELERRSRPLTEVRILDLLIWSVAAA